MRISDWSSDVCSSDLGLATVIDRQLADGCRSGAARVIKDVIDNTPDMTRAARRLFGKSVTATACWPSSLIKRTTTTWPALCPQKPSFSRCATTCWAVPRAGGLVLRTDPLQLNALTGPTWAY